MEMIVLSRILTWILRLWRSNISLQGILTIEQGAVSSVYGALLPAGVTSPRGDYLWHDKQIVDWVNGPLPSPGYWELLPNYNS